MSGRVVCQDTNGTFRVMETVVVWMHLDSCYVLLSHSRLLLRRAGCRQAGRSARANMGRPRLQLNVSRGCAVIAREVLTANFGRPSRIKIVPFCTPAKIDHIWRFALMGLHSTVVGVSRNGPLFFFFFFATRTCCSQSRWYTACKFLRH